MKAESKATPGLFEHRIKDKIKEIEAFVTTDCLTVMYFPFGSVAVLRGGGGFSGISPPSV
jgi:hypothetical protein